jgi:hypothetical protein
MSMHVTWHEPETKNKLVVFEWGFEGGREFIEGDQWSGTDGDEPTAKIKYAFDGEKQRNFRHNTGEMWSTGGLYGLTPTTFSVYGTPKALLGYAIKQKSQETLAEILGKAREVTTKQKFEEIDGHSCCLIEALGVQDGKNVFDIRAWIDTERHFRPLKLERFKRRAGHDQWELIDVRVDNIELRRIDGMWFPARGERQYFRTRYLAPEGMSEVEFTEAFGHLPIEEQRKRQRVITMPRHPKRRIDIAIDTIQINKGINPEMFKVSFPDGCRVWDDFAQMGYKVGTGGEQIPDALVTEGGKRYDPAQHIREADVSSSDGEPDTEEGAGRMEKNVVGEDATSGDSDMSHSENRKSWAVFALLTGVFSICALFFVARWANRRNPVD